ncbi:MAG: magnesium transporter [Clostridia bacterium]|nr:magnesium transporter [Clostridia bacterium]
MKSLDEILQVLKTEKYAVLREQLVHLEAADIAWLLTQLDNQQTVTVFRLLPKETAAEVFVELESQDQELLIDGFTDGELKRIVNDLYNDDAADLIEELPANVVQRILKQADPEKRAVINQLLKYPGDSVGSIMTTEYVNLKASMTVQEAFQRIRRLGMKSETVYTCYVTDGNRKLEGVITVRELLFAEPSDTISALMERNVVFFRTLDDREEIARAFEKYDFLAFPIVDSDGRLVGIVTVDDAMDVLQEENTEDIEKMAAIVPTDKPYLKTGILTTFLKRIPWLLVLMISGTFTGRIITMFETALAAQAVLDAFIPMLMDAGGNAGSQASVTIIRGLSLQELRFRDYFRVLWKEVRVAVLCGAVLATGNFLKILMVDNLIFRSGISMTVAAIVCITLFFTVLLAKVVGCSLPMLAERIGFDPAVMASPFITTIVDAMSLLVYFGFAKFLLSV